MGKQYGKWEIIRDLEEGGQGYVFLVKEKDGKPDEQFILKRLKNQKRLDRFKAEIESLHKLDHPGIAKLVDFDITNKTPWFVQEYYAGGDLEQYVKQSNPLDIDEIFDLLTDLASALEYAHKHGFLHRDIKPANIFLKGKNGPAILGDFGLVWKDDAGERLTLTDEAVGSFHYRAPELSDGRVEEPTKECDIYSLGKVLYFILSGGRIFDREVHREDKWNLVRIHKEFSLEHVNNLLDHMITFNPNNRFSAENINKASREIKRLIKGEYAPLEGDTTSSRCKYCGRGRHIKVVNSNQEFMQFFGFLPNSISGSNRAWRVMACNVCGHLEFFRMDVISPYGWWPEKK
jgi:serine/threonine protein kinase